VRWAIFRSMTWPMNESAWQQTKTLVRMSIWLLSDMQPGYGKTNFPSFASSNMPMVVKVANFSLLWRWPISTMKPPITAYIAYCLSNLRFWWLWLTSCSSVRLYMLERQVLTTDLFICWKHDVVYAVKPLQKLPCS
jgi:hypothetical protein